MLSMLAGAAVEWYRLRLFQQGAVLTASPNRGTQPAIVDISVFYQIPQYILVGLSEVTCTPRLSYMSPRHLVCRILECDFSRNFLRVPHCIRILSISEPFGVWRLTIA